MARILLSHFSPFTENNKYVSFCFFDALAKGFQECGNDVKHIISTRFVTKAWFGANDCQTDIDQERLKEEIKNFKPDLCVFANNSVPALAYEVTNCPVLLLLSDSVMFFNDLEKLKQKEYGDRVFYYAPFPKDIQDIKALIGADQNKIIHALPATGVESKNVPFSQNISYIGSHFINAEGIVKALRAFPDRNRLKHLVYLASNNTDALLAALLPHEKELIGEYVPVADFCYMFSPRNRVLTLTLLADLGLSLYGPDSWQDTASYFPELACAYEPGQFYTLEHNQDIYNASKICLNISHTQAVGGFPWRVFDIMASNGCLLSDRKEGIEAFTKGYVDLPMYDSPMQARELATKLLSDEIWRKELVEGSQRCIEKQGRWKHRFPMIEAATGVKLLGQGTGSLSYLYGEDFIPAVETTVKKKGTGKPTILRF